MYGVEKALLTIFFVNDKALAADTKDKLSHLVTAVWEKEGDVAEYRKKQDGVYIYKSKWVGKWSNAEKEKSYE